MAQRASDDIERAHLRDPHDRTVTVYRPGARPETFNDAQELTAEPHLPGFRVEVARLFE